MSTPSRLGDLTAAVRKRTGLAVRALHLVDELGRPDDEIVVRIVATGICHTDAHTRPQGYETPLPLVLGHEGVGIVESVGRDVASVSPGDRVVMSFPSCGRCNHCLSGHPALRLSFGGARLVWSSPEAWEPRTS